MFNNEVMADVFFLVGPPGSTQRVPGHKVRLQHPGHLPHPGYLPHPSSYMHHGVCISVLWNYASAAVVLCNCGSCVLQYVLAVGSSVFHAMFYGELAEDQGEIRIPDVEPPSFLAMLKWVLLP